MTYLSRLPFRILLTTNFDPWVGDICYPGPFEKMYIYPNIPINQSSNRCLYYLHGRFCSDDENPSIRNLVFGKKSFDVAYNESLLPGFLLNIFVYENILFVGFNPTESSIEKLLYKSIGIRSAIKASFPGMDKHLGQRYALWPTLNTETLDVQQEHTFSELRSLEVIPIPYEQKGVDCRGLESLLFSWIVAKSLLDRKDPF